MGVGEGVNVTMKKITTKTKLKLCPFCGESAAELWMFGKGIIEYAVVCGSCHAQTKASSSKEVAIDFWNKRASDEVLRLRAKADRLEADLIESVEIK
jgi:Lar family restriction alleviation protein